MEEEPDVESPEKKKTKQREEPGKDKGEEEEDDEQEDEDQINTLEGLRALVKKLKTKQISMYKEFSQFRDDVQRVLGMGIRRYDKRYQTATTLKFAAGYETPRTVSDVQFRTPDGVLRYPGMDRVDSPKKAEVQVVYAKASQPEKILSVPYYQAMEQVQINTRTLDRLNESVLPLLRTQRLMLNALMLKLTGQEFPILSLRHTFPSQDRRFWVLERPAVPHLEALRNPSPAYAEGHSRVPSKVLDSTKRSRQTEEKEEEARAGRDAQARARIENEERTAKEKMNEMVRGMVVMAPQELRDEIAALRKQVDVLMNERLDVFGLGNDPLFGIPEPGESFF